MTRMPESAAPKLGKVDSLVVMDVDVPANANGVLYALAGFSGGVTCYVKDGYLKYEFNLFEIQRTKIQSKEKLPTGKVKIEVESRLVGRIGGPMDITLRAEWRRRGTGSRSCCDVAPFHFQRNLRYRLRPRLAGVTRLLRSGAVPLQWHDWQDEDYVPQEVKPRGTENHEETFGLHPRTSYQEPRVAQKGLRISPHRRFSEGRPRSFPHTQSAAETVSFQLGYGCELANG